MKWDDLAVSLPTAIDSILRGHQLAMTEPKGPVYISLDVGLQKEKLDKPVVIPDVSRYTPPSPIQADPTALKKAAEFLVEAEHPVVIADYVGKNPRAVEALSICGRAPRGWPRHRYRLLSGRSPGLQTIKPTLHRYPT